MSRAVARRAAVVAMVSTFCVVAIKAVGAAASGSVAVLGEVLQSTVDIAMSLATVWTIGLASRPADENHPYGHGKAELLGSALQTMLVIGSAGYIAVRAITRVMAPEPISAVPGLAAMAAAAVIGIGTARYVRTKSLQTRSIALESEARHLEADVLASLAVVFGLALVQATQLRWLDSASAILIAGVTAYIGLRQLQRVLHPLMDGSLPDSKILEIDRVMAHHPMVRGYHDLRTRETGTTSFVSLHVLLDDHLTFVDAHELAELIESELASALGDAHVTVHYEPHDAEMAHRKLEHEGGSDPS